MPRIFQHKSVTRFGESKFQMISFRDKAYDTPKGIIVKTLIKIETPGGDTFEGIMTEDHQRRFHAEHEAWKAGNDAMVKGTPLEGSYAFEQEIIDELAQGGIFTLEQLSDAPDSFCKTKKAKNWRERAKNILGVKDNSRYIERLESDLEVAREEIKELRGNIRRMQQDVGASMEAKETEKKSKRKRAVAQK